MTKCRILSCDGGGIRGLVTALLIKDLDEKFDILKEANWFAGTSTGGLLALALAHGVPMERIIYVYTNQGKDIFEPLSSVETQEDNGEHGRQSASGLDGTSFEWCQYKNKGVRKIAEKMFGSTVLSDLTVAVAISSNRLWDAQASKWTPCTFSNAGNNPYRDISLVDAALATSAAPTYFPLYEVEGFGYFVDGGVSANNPAMSAVSEALGQNGSPALDDLRVLSLGTGSSPEGIRPEDVGNPEEWGIIPWLTPLHLDKQLPPTALLNLALDANSELASMQAEKILGRKYQRGNFVLPEPFPLDDWQRVSDLERWTNAYIRTNPEWVKVCNWVKNNWS